MPSELARINQQFYGNANVSGVKCAELRGRARMLHIFLMRSATTLLSAILGGVGVFCVIESFTMPVLAFHALILLATATAIASLSRR